MALKTDFKNEILANGKTYRDYDIVDSSGRTLQSNIHLVRKDVPSQVGDIFGAQEINNTNKMIEEIIIGNQRVGKASYSDQSATAGAAGIANDLILKSSTAVVDSKYNGTVNVLQLGKIVILIIRVVKLQHTPGIALLATIPIPVHLGFTTVSTVASGQFVNTARLVCEDSFITAEYSDVKVPIEVHSTMITVIK